MKKIIYAALAFSPVLALADTTAINNTAVGLATTFDAVIKLLVPAFFGLAIVYFFYGVAKYVLAAGDPKKASEGKSIMIYGVIAIAVMALLYGIITFLGSSLGITTGSTPTTLPGGGTF